MAFYLLLIASKPQRCGELRPCRHMLDHAQGTSAGQPFPLEARKAVVTYARVAFFKPVPMIGYDEIVPLHARTLTQPDALPYQRFGCSLTITSAWLGRCSSLRLHRGGLAPSTFEAQQNLGLLYFDGKGVPRNYDAAHELFQLAAKQGSPDAHYMLGQMYERGKNNLVTARKHYEAAAKLGDSEAIQKLRTIGRG
jgi:hypothetical protein